MYARLGRRAKCQNAFWQAKENDFKRLDNIVPSYSQSGGGHRKTSIALQGDVPSSARASYTGLAPAAHRVGQAGGSRIQVITFEMTQLAHSLAVGGIAFLAAACLLALGSGEDE